MNDTEMQMLRTLFDTQPPAPHVTAAGRARLREGYRAGGFRMPRFSLPALAGLGTAAVVAAAAAAVVVTVASSPVATRPPATAAPTGHLTAAGQVLLTAARTVAAEPAVVPKPSQWLRVETVQSTGGKTATDENWMTFNGARSAYYQGGKLVIHFDRTAATSDATPMAAYDALSKLPPYPKNLLKALEEESAGQGYTSSNNPEIRAWNNIVQLLWDSPVAAQPKLQAEIFVALEKLPGLRVERVTDVTGKTAIGLYLPAAGHSDLLLDRSTYQVIGRRTVSTGHYTKAEQVMAKAKHLKLPPAGTVTWSVIRDTTLVSGPGQS
jgi:hypothetical protein